MTDNTLKKIVKWSLITFLTCFIVLIIALVSWLVFFKKTAEDVIATKNNSAYSSTY